jgi:hypothetical protein
MHARQRFGPALALLIVACGAAPTSSSTESAGGDVAAQSLTGTIAVGSVVQTTGDLNLRSGPSTSDDVIDVLPKGTQATIVDATPQGGFYHLSWNGEDGWSSGRYLELISSPPPPTPADAGAPISTDSGSSGPAASLGVGAGAAPWTCTGSYSVTPVDTGSYYLTSFGCWTDSSGTVHTDPGDNCIPGCLSKAQNSGLCPAGSSGPDCEESVTWYVADAGRFGCLQRLRIINPSNGKSVIAVALDYGPACWVEDDVSHGVLDASGAVDRYLFGSDEGYDDKAGVVIELVDGATPLGPE